MYYFLPKPPAPEPAPAAAPVNLATNAVNNSPLKIALTAKYDNIKQNKNVINNTVLAITCE